MKLSKRNGYAFELKKLKPAIAVIVISGIISQKRARAICIWPASFIEKAKYWKNAYGQLDDTLDLGSSELI